MRTRCLIENLPGVADKFSRMDHAKKADGFVDLYLGPTAPAGHEKNGIPANLGQAWFASFRLYAPMAAYYDPN